MVTQLNNKIKTFGSRIYDRFCYAMILATLLFVPNAHAIDEAKTLLFDLSSVTVLFFNAFFVLSVAYMVIAGLFKARSKKDGWGNYFLATVIVIIVAVLACQIQVYLDLT